MRRRRTSGRRRRHRGGGGFSLVEAVLSMALVAGLLVSSLAAVGAAAATRARADRRVAAVALADALLAEALGAAYDDPQDGPVAGPSTGWRGPGWGPEPGEGGAGRRDRFDDADDFDGWSSTPPRDRGGTPVADAAGFTRSAVVRHVNADDPSVEAAADAGLKRIVVRVHRGDRLLAEAVGLSTRRGPGGTP